MFTCTVTLTPVLVNFVNNSLTILHHVIVYCGYLAEINFCPAGSSGHITVFQREAPTQTYNFRHDSSVVILKRCLEGAGLVPAPCGSSGSDSPYKGPAGKSSWEWRQNAGFFFVASALLIVIAVVRSQFLRYWGYLVGSGFWRLKTVPTLSFKKCRHFPWKALLIALKSKIS